MADFAPFKYRAFLSYSHRDKKWGEWLHHALENYRVDKDLVGRVTPSGPVPKTLRPIFRDREDFSAGHSLTEQTLRALESSQFLIAVCSPDAARSQYVNEEIRRFKEIGRAARIIPLIVDGEPGNSDRECFPPAIRFKLAPDGTLSDEREEPIAADARDAGDGKDLAKQKLVAGLLGVGLDEIVRRAERARRRRNRFWAALAGVFLLLAVAATGSAVYAYQKLIESEDRLAEAIEIAYGFVTEASSMSSRFGVPTEITLALLRRAESALNGLIAKQPNSATLRHRRAKMLMEFADQYQKLGQLDEATRRALEAQQLLANLVKENSDNSEWQYQLAGAHDLLAIELYYRGDSAGTLLNRNASVAVLERLAAREPDNVRWQISLLWSRRVVGELLLEQGSSTQALATIRKAAQEFQRFTKDHPGRQSGPGLDVAIAKLLDSLANVLAMQGSYEAALKVLQSNLDRKKERLALNPNSFLWQFELRDSYRYVGSVLFALGSFDDALGAFRNGLAIDHRAIAADSKFLGPQRSAILFEDGIANVLLAKGSLFDALGQGQKNLAAAEKLAAVNSRNDAWSRQVGGLHETLAEILEQQGDLAGALREYEAAYAVIEPLLSRHPRVLDWQFALALAKFGIGEILQGQKQFDQARESFRSALAIFDHLAGIDPRIVNYQVMKLMTRWHLVECGDESVGPQDAIRGDLIRLKDAKKLSALQRRWLASSELATQKHSP